MSCGVSLRVNPPKLIVASVFNFGFRDLRNSSIISSSWPWSLSQNDIQCAQENKSTTSGVSRNFLESEGSFLMNPPGMVKKLYFCCFELACSCIEGELRDFSTQSAELRLRYAHSHVKFTIFHRWALTVSQFFYRRDFNSRPWRKYRMQTTKTISCSDKKTAFEFIDRLAFTFSIPPQHVEFTTFWIICMGKLCSGLPHWEFPPSTWIVQASS